jgi:hypothetical protein
MAHNQPEHLLRMVNALDCQGAVSEANSVSAFATETN